MPQLINWEIVRQPLNWLIVGAIFAFWLILIGLAFPEPPAAPGAVTPGAQ